jgi:hypothetical protein
VRRDDSQHEQDSNTARAALKLASLASELAPLEQKQKRRA